jgi:membrane protease YdiL (CAAX protease family)
MANSSRASLQFLAAFLAGFAVLWLALFTAVWQMHLVPAQAGPWLRMALWLGAVVLWLQWTNQPSPARWLGLTTFRLEHMGVMLLVMVCMYGAQLFWANLTGAAHHRLAHLTVMSWIMAPLVLFLDELLFRGVVQTRLAESLPPAAAILIAALLFFLSRVPFWMLGSSPDYFVIYSTALAGVICGGLRHGTGSLWPGFGVRFAHYLGTLV